MVRAVRAMAGSGIRIPSGRFAPVKFALAPKLVLCASILALASGCTGRGGEIVEGGIRAIRSACPVVAIPAGAGDITLFDPPLSRLASAIDVSATITDLKASCDDAGDPIATSITFTVNARRQTAADARTVTLPYFVAVVRGDDSLVSKSVSRIAVNFAPGELRASAIGQATASVSRAAATLPEDIRKQLTRQRKAGDEDAAIDPLADPEVRTAVARSTFEALVGFQLDQNQLRYNVTR